MLPLLQLCLLALVASQSLIPTALGQDDFAFGRRVPRNSDLTNQVPLSPRKLFSLQGRQPESDDLSVDLMPQAQSYFIEPELPTTTSVRPMFKRRKTLRPISTAEAERRKQELSEASRDDQVELPTKKPFKPFRPIHNTGFAKQRPSSGQRPRNRAQTEENTNEDGNNANYELNEIQTTTEGQSEPTPKDAENGNPNSFRRFQPGRRKKITPTFSPQIKIGNPNRFQARRNIKPSSPSANPTETSQPESTPSNRNLRNGRPGFVLRPKPQEPEVSNGETRPLRRRKKPSTDPPSTDDQSVQNTENIQVSEAPTGRKIPSDNISASEDTVSQPRRNMGFQRRPNLRPRQSKSLPLEVTNQSDFPVSMSMRVRQAHAKPQDSAQESSDSVPIVAASTSEEAVAPDTGSEPVVDTYRPRNLSQRPSALDKLSNRQASARRFLTPKKVTEQGTTVAPVVIASSKPGRRSPLSLQNLRNRRLGKQEVTTTTEAAPVESSVVVDSDNSTVLNGTETVKEHTQPEFDSEDKKDDTVIVNADGTKDTESEAPKVEALPVPRRPLLPGQRKPLMGRVPLLSKPRVTTTTAKPVHEEMTPAPTCEDGKRYNKVLRKCIPPFAPRSG